MKFVLTHSENIKTFAYISRNLELKVKRINAHFNTLLVAQAGKSKVFRPKRKQHERSTGATNSLGPRNEKLKKHHRGMRGSKDQSKLKFYNCGKVRHFARECTEAKKVSTKHNSLITYVCSHIFVAHSIPEWIVDTGATKHVTRDRVGFIYYRRISVGKHYVILANVTREEVLGIDTFQLKMRLRCLLLLHDVLCAPCVQCNLFPVIYMLELGFTFHFDDPQLDFYLDKTLYGHDFLSNGFFMLDLDNSSFFLYGFK